MLPRVIMFSGDNQVQLASLAHCTHHLASSAQIWKSFPVLTWSHICLPALSVRSSWQMFFGNLRRPITRSSPLVLLSASLCPRWFPFFTMTPRGMHPLQVVKFFQVLNCSWNSSPHLLAHANLLPSNGYPREWLSKKQWVNQIRQELQGYLPI